MKYLVRFADGSSVEVEAMSCFEADRIVRAKNPKAVISMVSPIVLSQDDETYDGRSEDE